MQKFTNAIDALQGGDSSEASYELDVAAGELRFNGKTAWRLERA